MTLPCPHSPGTVVELDRDVVWSTCVAGCDQPIWQLYDVGDEDRVGRGWGVWRLAPARVDAADVPSRSAIMPERRVA